jgi:hypothetical protein
MNNDFAPISGDFTGEISVGYSVLGDGAQTIRQRYESEGLAADPGADLKKAAHRGQA